MKYGISKLIAPTALAFMLSTGATVRAGQLAPPTSPPIPSDPVAMGRSGLGGAGDFTGTIVELSCDQGSPPGTRTECEGIGHYYALQTEDHLALQPLLGGTQPILDKLRSGGLTGKQVRVSGIRYQSTGAILVSDIQPRRPGTGFGLLTDEGEQTSTRR